MKMITGGVGIDSISVGKTSTMLYGNLKLAELFPGLRMTKVVNNSDGSTQFTFTHDEHGSKVLVDGRRQRTYWAKVHGSALPPATLFGRTPVSGIAEVPSGFVATVGAKRRPLMNRVRRVTDLAVEGQGEPQVELFGREQLYSGAATLAVDAFLAREQPYSGAERWENRFGSACDPTSQKPIQEASSITLAAAVRAINSHRRNLGDDLVLSITEQGTLRAQIIQEYE